MKKKLYINVKLYFLLFFIFLPNSVQANNIKNSAVIFMYHKFDRSDYPSTNITMEQFNDHLLEFTKPKYNVMSLDFIVDTIINDGSLPNHTIGISIDDADRSFLDKGWPLLKKHGLPATLFVSTNTIVDGNKNYLNWSEIRKMKSEGLTIGAHSHNHGHFAEFTLEELINEIEKSNRVFLKELGEIPTLFAYPYGEADEIMFELLNQYNFKGAFGQHSGIMNETSNYYYLPRFSLNEKYGDIDRVKFAVNTKGLGVYDFIPTNPNLNETNNPPYIGFSLLDQGLANKIQCFIFDSEGQVESEVYRFNERIEIRLKRKLTKGRSRMNCTVKDEQKNWRWFGHQFYL